MVIDGIKIHIVPQKQLTDYMCYIKTDELPFILKGEASVFGIDNLANDHVGTAVVEEAPEPDNGSGCVLVIRDLYLTQDYRTPEVLDVLINKISEEVIRRDYKGIVMQNAYPDNPEYEAYLEENCLRLDDGNTIYEVDVDLMYDHPFFKKTSFGLGGSVVRISDLDRYDKTAFLNEWDDHFPKGLSPDNLPGKWLQNLSFAYRKNSGFCGYVLTSELSPVKLYIGGVYTDPGEPLAAAAFICVLAREIILDSDYRKVMFAAATGEGITLCDKILKGIHSIKKWNIHNYYLEV